MKKRPIALPMLAGLLTFFAQPVCSDTGIVIAQSRPAQPTQDDSLKTQLDEARRIIKQMKADPGVVEALRKTKGLFLLPKYDRKAMTVGGPGVRGILMVRDGAQWSNPVFYNIGPIILGAHAGAGLNALAAFLISDDAVAKFTSGQRFSLSSDDGFNMTDHDDKGVASPDEGDDVIMWSDAAGIFPGAAVRVDGIRPDEGANRSFYGKSITPRELMRERAGSDRRVGGLHEELRQ